MAYAKAIRSTAVHRRLAAVPPGPRGLPVLGSLGRLGFDTHRTFLRAREEYGDLVHFRVGNRHVYLVAYPDDIKHVLVDNNRNYGKGRALQKTKPLLGEGLLTSEADFWRRQRRLAQPAFHRDQIASLGDIMTTATAELIERWQPLASDGRGFDGAAEMMQLTLNIVGKALFNTALTEAEIGTVSADLPPLLRYATRRAHGIFDFVERLPTRENRRREQRIARLNKIVYRIIEQRRQSRERHDDLLGMLMAARDEETGASMNDEQLRDEVMTLFLAGHETTAQLMSWTWMLLSRHPDVRRRVEQEVDDVLGGRTPTAVDVSKLRFVGSVIAESMRLYPPAWAIMRSPIGADEIRGYPIPPGAVLILSPYVTQRHPEFWDNPEGFQPERFASGESSGRHRFAYFPFGGGPRLCIGNNFALLEATLIVAMVSQRYRLDLIPGRPIEPEARFTLRPKNGVPLRAVPRRSPARPAVGAEPIGAMSP